MLVQVRVGVRYKGKSYPMHLTSCIGSGHTTRGQCVLSLTEVCRELQQVAEVATPGCNGWQVQRWVDVVHSWWCEGQDGNHVGRSTYR